jgi:hypothetical protein
MADQNAKVVCPDCGENGDCRPSQAAESDTAERKIKKIQ